MNTRTGNQETECQKMSEALSAHFDGEASEIEKHLATAHLACCENCAQMWHEWQGLRSMQQRAQEPIRTCDMLPLAPVNVPRNLKTTILRKTVSIPIWHRFWPRLLTGIAVPTLAVGCWLLATPWQEPIPEMNGAQNPVAEGRIVELPDTPNTAPPRSQKSPPQGMSAENDKITGFTSSQPVIVKTETKRSPREPRERAVRVASTKSRISRTKSTLSKSHKSTFARKSQPVTPNSKPQISLAAFERPRSHVATTMNIQAAKVIKAVAPKPRITNPARITAPPSPTPRLVALAEEDSDPVVDYIAANDVRPENIRLAVENYRAALLDDGSEL